MASIVSSLRCFFNLSFKSFSHSLNLSLILSQVLLWDLSFGSGKLSFPFRQLLSIFMPFFISSGRELSVIKARTLIGQFHVHRSGLPHFSLVQHLVSESKSVNVSLHIFACSETIELNFDRESLSIFIAQHSIYATVGVQYILDNRIKKG